MKKSIGFLSFIFLSLSMQSAFACFSRDAYEQDTEAVLEAYENNASFQVCLSKLEDLGVDADNLKVQRVDNPRNGIAYSLKLTNTHKKQKPYNMVLDYKIKKKGFVCGKVLEALPRCFGQVQ